MMEAAKSWIGRAGLALAKRFSYGAGDIDEWGSVIGGPTAAGIRVSPSSALAQPEVRMAIDNLASDMARMPLPILMKDAQGKKVEQRANPLWNLLNVRANPEMTAFELRRQQFAQFFAHGNFATQVIRDRIGRPLELWPLEWDRLSIEGDIRPGKQRTYQYWERDGSSRTLRRDELFMMADFNLSGQCGESRIRAAADTIGLALAIELYAARFFANGGRPLLLLKHPSGFKDEQSQREAIKRWNEQFSGMRAHGVGFLTKGLELEKDLPSHNNEAQMIEARRHQKEQHATLFRTPPHMLQDLSRGTFSNISRQGVEYVVYSLLTHLTQYEQTVARDLMSPGEVSRGVYARHNVKALLRGDVEAQGNFYRLMVGWGLFTINEIRDLEEYDPVEGGDVFLRPRNMVAVGLDGQIVPGQESLMSSGSQPNPPEDLSDGQRQQVRDEIGSMIEELLGVRR